MATQRLCSIPGCGKSFYARNLCRTHHANQLRSGTIAPIRKHAKAGLGMALVQSALASSTNDCILWPYAKDGRGYGMFFIKKPTRPHTYVCAQRNGPRPTGMLACHSCGNSLCVNPRHLYWGTSQDNADDAARHGTVYKGERHMRSRLTDELVRSIRRAPENITSAAIARRIGVHKTTVQNARKGLSWRHVV